MYSDLEMGTEQEQDIHLITGGGFLVRRQDLDANETEALLQIKRCVLEQLNIQDNDLTSWINKFVQNSMLSFCTIRITYVRGF